jgi:hypothetical protein
MNSTQTNTFLLRQKPGHRGYDTPVSLRATYSFLMLENDFVKITYYPSGLDGPSSHLHDIQGENGDRFSPNSVPKDEARKVWNRLTELGYVRDV